MRTRLVGILTAFVFFLGLLSTVGVGAAPVFFDYSIDKVNFYTVTEKDGVTTGTFINQTVVSGISITPSDTMSAIIEGSQDGEHWVRIWDTGFFKTQSEFGLFHGTYANYLDKSVFDSSPTYAWTHLRIISNPANVSFTYELYGYETQLSGYTVAYDTSFGYNGVEAVSYYKDDRCKHLGNHVLNQWGKGDAVATVDGIATLTVKFVEPVTISGFAFAHRSGDPYLERWNSVIFQASVNGVDWVDLAASPPDAKDTMTLDDLALVSVNVDNTAKYEYARILSSQLISVSTFDVYAADATPAGITDAETTVPEETTTAPVDGPVTDSEESTDAPTTTAPDTSDDSTSASDTSASDVTTTPETEKTAGGCKSALGTTLGLIFIPAGLLTLRKRKAE